MDIESFMKTATADQKNVLFELARLAEQENDLATKINGIKSSMKSGIYSPDGASIALCEDEDDAMVISLGPRMELQKVRDSVKALMKEAVALGMKDVGIIARNYEHYTGERMP
jgi:hypothetical protein